MDAPSSPGVHSRRIITYCFLVCTPMFASSFIVVYIVYANLVSAGCPSEELCPGPINGLSIKDHYYVDFPAARLAFISSGSATVSFALLALLMAMHSYTSSAALIYASEKTERESLPTPYQLSVLLRVLNAELAVLWELAFSKIRRVFWHQEANKSSTSRSAPLIRTGVIVLLAGIIASLFVQAADIYFHIAAEAVPLIQLERSSAADYQFSRGLAPWCLDKPEFGNAGEEKFWGCAITAQKAPYNNATSLAPTNASMISDMKNAASDQHKTITFTDPNGVQYALVGPANNDAGLDWEASSFGVSTTCSAIPDGGCAVSEPISNAKDGRSSPVMLVPFNCTKARAGLNIVGNLTSHNTATHMMDFHNYAAESNPFFDTSMVKLNVSTPQNVPEDSNGIFKNGWTVLAMRKIPSAVQGDFSQLPASFATDNRIWKHQLLGAFVLLYCNVTVWDVTYKSVLSNVTILGQTPSNGSVAGMASMPGTRQIGTLANIFQDEATGPSSRSSPDNFIHSFELGMSKAYSYPLASQTSSRPSLRMQIRTSTVVTKLPFAALWCLVAANIAYAFLALGIAICAIMRVTKRVGEVQIRLGVVGLVAALFNQERFEGAAVSDQDLFDEKSSRNATSTKRIAVIETKSGGASFVVGEEKLYQLG